MPVDKSPERVRGMFSQIAPRYDLLNHLLSANIDRRWRRVAVERCPPRGNAPILDVCTGTGDLALAYAAAGDAPVIGADFCREMLEIARTKAAKQGRKVQFVEADAATLPFPDNRFQIVSAAFGLRNVCDTAKGLSEFTRVAAPGGRVVVLEFSQPTVAPFRQIYRAYFSTILPRIGQAMARNDASAYSYLPDSVGEFPSGEALAELMRAEGLRDVSFLPLTFGIATLYWGVK